MTSVLIKQAGHSVEVTLVPVAGDTWPDVLETAIQAVRAHYGYVTMLDVLEHLDEEYGYLKVEKYGTSSLNLNDLGEVYVTEVNLDNDSSDNNDGMRGGVWEETTSNTDPHTNAGSTVCGTAD